MSASTLDRNWATLRSGRCWLDGAELFDGEGGWVECIRCGRSFVTTAGARAERIPLDPSLLGKRVPMSGLGMFVLTLGEVVPISADEDGSVLVPSTAVAIEFRYDGPPA